MIDFSKLPQKKKLYTGANGSKRCVVYNGEMYMVKFPPYLTINKDMSYANSCISEYIGCHIFESVGIPVQSTLLGIYQVNGNEKIVVACKDFTCPHIVLQDFASLKNQVIDTPRQGSGTELSVILSSINEQTVYDPHVLSEHFWNVFIIDALIGNWDRHNGNWGFLYDTINDTHTLAPIYDCGSALYPQMDEALMESVLMDKSEMDLRIYERPLSAILQNGKKIKYFAFISSLEEPECNEALKRMAPKIDLNKIYQIIDDTPFISDLQKRFYRQILTLRKERIIDYPYQLLLEREQANIPSLEAQVDRAREKQARQIIEDDTIHRSTRAAFEKDNETTL